MVDLKVVKELRDRTNLGMNDCKKALEQANGNIEAAIDLLKKWGELKGKEKANVVATEGRVALFANNAATVAGLIEVNCQTDFVAKSPEFFDLVNSFSKMDGFSETEFEKKRHNLIAKTGENIVLRRRDTFTVADGCKLHWYMHPGDRLAVLMEVYGWPNTSHFGKEVLTFADDCAMQIAAMAPLVVTKDQIPGDMLIRQRKIFEAQLAEEKKPEQAWPKIIEGKFNKWRKEIVLLEQDSIKDPKQTIDMIRQGIDKHIGGQVQITRFLRYALGEGQEKKQENLAEEVEKLIG
jgi:elongation factor Ts